jgi:hypothetical protein
MSGATNGHENKVYRLIAFATDVSFEVLLYVGGCVCGCGVYVHTYIHRFVCACACFVCVCVCLETDRQTERESVCERVV